MKVHVLQHLPCEDLGSIGPNLEARRAEIRYTRFYENPQLPAPGGIDLVIVMGGSMSVNDEQQLPWLKPEKQFIRDSIDRDIPVLGVCLGAQLIASALGARVYRNSFKEIGWFPVHGVPVPDGVFSFPDECPAFHWHGETFDLPEGSVRLAESAGCKNQAFQFKRNVIGLQFHMETTRETAFSLLDQFCTDLTPGPYVQTETAIRTAPPEFYQTIHAIMDEILSYLH